jgi:negative regulator of replication initiation
MASQPPSPDIETLVDILAKTYGDGSRTSYDALDMVVGQISARLAIVPTLSLGADFGSDSEERRPIVKAILDRCAQEGGVRDAVAIFYAQLAWSEPLRIWVAANTPDLAGAVSEAAFRTAQVAHRSEQQASEATNVIAAINAVRAAGNEALVQQQIGASRTALVALSGQLQTLNAYKAIHDRLHALQTGFYQSVASIAGRSAAFTPDQEEQVTLEAKRVSDGADTLDQFLAIAQGDDLAPDAQWRQDLAAVIATIAQPPVTVDKTSGGLIVVRDILRKRLTVYDEALVRVASALPLGKIVSLLRATGQLDHVPDSVAAAANDMSAMSATLASRVAQHRQWQEIETTLWPIEQEVIPHAAPPNRFALTQFAAQLARQLAAVRAADPASWDGNIDAVMASATALTADGIDPAATAVGFAEVIRIVRLQFAKIDKMLLEQCTQVVRLGAPLRQLLGSGGL